MTEHTADSLATLDEMIAWRLGQFNPSLWYGPWGQSPSEVPHRLHGITLEMVREETFDFLNLVPGLAPVILRDLEGGRISGVDYTWKGDRSSCGCFKAEAAYALHLTDVFDLPDGLGIDADSAMEVLLTGVLLGETPRDNPIAAFFAQVLRAYIAAHPDEENVASDEATTILAETESAHEQ